MMLLCMIRVIFIVWSVLFLLGKVEVFIRLLSNVCCVVLLSFMVIVINKLILLYGFRLLFIVELYKCMVSNVDFRWCLMMFSIFDSWFEILMVIVIFMMFNV